MIYLDYASHTPVNPAVLEEFCNIEQQFTGNPSSKHKAGTLSNNKLEEINQKTARLLNIKPSDIIYTSGASESNNLALKGLARSYRHNGKHILSTCLEHPSVSGVLTSLQEQGHEIELIDICPDGTIDLQHLKELLRSDTVMVSIGYIDSELGAVQPIQKVVEILREYPNCHLHVDATQAIGKLPVDLSGIDCISFSPHKFYGLCGIGILLKREGVILEPLIHGGVAMTPYRSGTSALGLAASACKALELAINHQKEHLETVTALHSNLINTFKNYPLVKINSPENGSPYILNLSVQGVKGSLFSSALDKYGICVSVKSACSAPGTPSRSVFAVSKNKKNAMCSWRISFSHLTTQGELDGFLSAFDKCYKELTK